MDRKPGPSDCPGSQKKQKRHGRKDGEQDGERRHDRVLRLKVLPPGQNVRLERGRRQNIFRKAAAGLQAASVNGENQSQNQADRKREEHEDQTGLRARRLPEKTGGGKQGADHKQERWPQQKQADSQRKDTGNAELIPDDLIHLFRVGTEGLRPVGEKIRFAGRGSCFPGKGFRPSGRGFLSPGRGLRLPGCVRPFCARPVKVQLRQQFVDISKLGNDDADRLVFRFPFAFQRFVLILHGAQHIVPEANELRRFGKLCEQVFQIGSDRFHKKSFPPAGAQSVLKYGL